MADVPTCPERSNVASTYTMVWELLWCSECFFFSGHCLKGAMGPGQKSPSLVFCDALWWTVSVSCVSGHGKDVNLHSGSTGHQTTCCFVEVCWTYGTKRAACSSSHSLSFTGLIIPHSFLWPSDNQHFSVIQILVFCYTVIFVPVHWLSLRPDFPFNLITVKIIITHTHSNCLGFGFNVLERHLLSS